MRTISSLLGTLTFGLHILVPLVGLIIVATRVRGLARRLGIAGCAVLVGTGVLQALWVFVAPRVIRSLGGATAYGAVSAALSIVSAAGLALVIGAVIARHSGAQTPSSLPPAQPQSSYQQAPYQQGPNPQGPGQHGPYPQDPYPPSPYPPSPNPPSPNPQAPWPQTPYQQGPGRPPS